MRIKPTMATHGTINPYDPQDDWATYEERLRHYFVANGVEDAGKKRSILLTVCGTPTYKLLRSLVEVGELNTKSFDELARLLKEHYDRQSYSDFISILGPEPKENPSPPSLQHCEIWLYTAS